MPLKNYNMGAEQISKKRDFFPASVSRCDPLLLAARMQHAHASVPRIELRATLRAARS